MNTIVFVLMVWTHNGYVVPTFEFPTLEKCNSVLQEMGKAVGVPGGFGTGIKGRCIKIEK
jgi:hypothetical protein